MITVIIPVYNEASELEKLLPLLEQQGELEIIVSDAGSTDATKKICDQFKVQYLKCACMSRAVQMNKGAAMASNEILYFVHADTIPPADFKTKITDAVHAGFKSGRFKTIFNSKSLLLKVNAFFTRFDWLMCYGGDQTLFVEKKIFLELNGFNESLVIMEDYDFTERLRQRTTYTIMDGKVLVSARKYDCNSWWKVQQANYRAVNAYKRKEDSQEIKRAYQSMLNKRR